MPQVLEIASDQGKMLKSGKSNNVIILSDIQDGTFAKNFVAECEAGKPEMNKIRKRDGDHHHIATNMREVTTHESALQPQL